MGTPHRWTYALEQLYEDQDPNLAVEVIAQLVSWLDPDDSRRSHRFELRETTRGGDHVNHDLVVTWDMGKLTEHDLRLEADLQRLRSGKTLTREDQTKYAAYGLAMVATSCLLHRRIVKVAYYRPPDLLLDTTPAALRGVEVAGRSSKGYGAFTQVLNGSSASGKPGKRTQLNQHEDVVEAYISLWCRDPLVAIWEKVKP
jgi:hypothetical protein